MLNYFYPKTTWGITISLLDMWNDMKIYRFDTSGNSVKEISVPITFGPVEKTQQVRTTDFPGDGKRYYLQLPRMALVPNGMTFNADRAYSLNEERFWLDEVLELSGSDSVFSDFQPTPYDYNFTLFIRTESMEDLSQILENITPYFTPKNMIQIKEFSFLNIERDLPVTLGGINFEFSDDLAIDEMRQVNASLDLIVEGWAYKKQTSAALVRVIQSRYFVGDGYALEYDTSGDTVSASYATSATDPTIQDAEYRTSGFFQTSAMPDSTEYDTSGFNTDSGVWWTHSFTFSASD